jgi:hypothetical protein
VRVDHYKPAETVDAPSWLDRVLADTRLGADCHAVARRLPGRRTINPAYVSLKTDTLGLPHGMVAKAINRLVHHGNLRPLDYDRAEKIYCLEIPIIQTERKAPVTRTERQEILSRLGRL